MNDQQNNNQMPPMDPNMSGMSQTAAPMVPDANSAMPVTDAGMQTPAPAAVDPMNSGTNQPVTVMPDTGNAPAMPDANSVMPGVAMPEPTTTEQQGTPVNVQDPMQTAPQTGDANGQGGMPPAGQV